jgi:tripartite-type tricarboxylate transporter receptor subunit TctC
MQHVPYRGTGAAMADLLAGRIPVMFTNTSDVLPYRGDPRLKLLAVTGSVPATAFPELPVLAGTGWLDVPVDTWNGLVAPAATPPDVVRRLSQALTPACADEGFRRAMAQLGTDPVCSSPTDFAAGIRAATRIWQDAVRRTGASIN